MLKIGFVVWALLLFWFVCCFDPVVAVLLVFQFIISILITSKKK